ncbi:glycosyltransferase family 2 protein [uncultured Chryseobacterium sp.]|uniref:glycosyltransferase family 2 protein n=1 Tax=uncultured Chryseobacterium sp. TaxID=259322 RepID=UPI0025903CA6|nr:glycosyltransferase family 2 protein [uncultured Chryseobacterium sp.]
MFSVVIPLYNKENSIRNTVQSVLNQSFADFEIVIVNDGSTDKSLEVVRQINDARIRIIDKDNGGVSSARNYGIKNAEKEWIAFLDGDDLWEIDHLQTIYNMIQQFPSDKVFCTSYIRNTQQFPKQQDNTVVVIEDYFEEAVKSHFFWTSVAVVNQFVFTDVGIFKENLSRGEDLELWARIGFKYRFIKSNKVTGVYVQDSENKLSFGKLKLKNSILSVISFDNLSQSQSKYFKRLIINKIKTSLVQGDFLTAIRLIFRYKIHLL